MFLNMFRHYVQTGPFVVVAAELQYPGPGLLLSALNTTVSSSRLSLALTDASTHVDVKFRLCWLRALGSSAKTSAAERILASTSPKTLEGGALKEILTKPAVR